MSESSRKILEDGRGRLGNELNQIRKKLQHRISRLKKREIQEERRFKKKIGKKIPESSRMILEDLVMNPKQVRKKLQHKNSRFERREIQEGRRYKKHGRKKAWMTIPCNRWRHVLWWPCPASFCTSPVAVWAWESSAPADDNGRCSRRLHWVGTPRCEPSCNWNPKSSNVQISGIFWKIIIWKNFWKHGNFETPRSDTAIEENSP